MNPGKIARISGVEDLSAIEVSGQNGSATIGDIADRLESYHFYSGKFPVMAPEDAAYFHPRPVEHPLMVSTRDVLRLFWRRHLQQRY